MKNILYILEDGRFGGMNKMIADVAYHISGVSYHAHLLVGKTENEFFINYLQQKDISFTTVPQRVLSKNIYALFRYFIAFIPDVIRLLRQINHLNPDLVYCNGSQQIKGVLAAFFLRKKIVWHMHDTYQPKALVVLFKFIKWLGRVNWFFVSSHRTIRFYGLDPSYCHITRPPIDTTFFKCGDNSKSLPVGSDIRILTISNVNSDKGLDVLVRTAAILNTNFPGLSFIVVGLVSSTGSESIYAKVLELAEDLQVRNIDFVGQKIDVRSMLLEADLYLCTSNNESGPISVFEALAMQVPVVSTDVGDLGDLFAQYRYGAVQPVGNEDALAEEVLAHLHDPGLITHKAAIGRRIAEQELDISICVARQIEAYEQIFATK